MYTFYITWVALLVTLINIYSFSSIKKKKNFTVNKLEEDNDLALVFGVNGDKYI